MALPLEADLDAILNKDEFATAVTYTPTGGSASTIYGIFDKPTVPVDAGGFVDIHEEQPRLTCKTTAVPSIGYDDTMVISSVTYKVRAWLHNGVGLSTIQLERQ